MSNNGVASVLELNSAELEGDSNSDSKYKCNLSSDSGPLIMGLNSEYCNNGGTSSGNLGLGLLPNFDESNLFQCDVTGVYEWIRQRTDSVSSTDLDDSIKIDSDSVKIESLDISQTIVTTAELTSPTEEVDSTDINNADQIDSVFANNLSSNLASESQSANINSSFLDELNGLQEEQLIKDSLMSEDVFHCADKDVSKEDCQGMETKKIMISDVVHMKDDDQKVKLIGSDQSKSPVVVLKNKSSLPYVKVPKTCILSGKIIKKEAYESLNSKSVLSTIDQASIEVTEDISSFQLSTDTPENTESFSNSDFESSEIHLMLTEDDIKHGFLHDSFVQSNVSQSGSISDGSEEKPTKAVVAISTNKLEDITEIIIKTDKGEELYKGKASDILKATNLGLLSNFGFKFENQTNSNKEKQKFPVQKLGVLNEEASSDGTGIRDEDKKEDNASEEEPITEALKQLGITGEDWDRFEYFKGEQRVWYCPQEACNSVFARLSWLKIHILTHYNVRPFKCNYEGCEWSFYTNFRLKRHKETHLKKKEFKCPVCTRSFTTIYNLHTHLRLHQRPADLLCSVPGCGQAFQTRRNMESHLKEHGMEHAPYMCEYEGCGKRYYSMNSLQSHCRIHQHSIDDLCCEFCSKIFDKPCRLRAHLRSHTGVKPYKCNYEGCDWAFTTSSKLHRHQAKHTQERRFACTLCSKAFLRSEHLKDHELKHYETRSFTCPNSDCGVTFTAKSSLYVHMKKHKSKIQNAKQCPVKKCKFVYLTKDELCAHVESCHKGTSLVLMDSVELMSGEDNFVSLEGLNFNKNDNTSPSGINLNNLSLEGIMVSVPEFTSTESTVTSTSPSQVTHVLLPDRMENVPSELITTSEIPLNVITSTSSTSSSMIDTVNLEPGCARTNLTYHDILTKRESDVQNKKQPQGNVRKRSVSYALESPVKEVPGLQVRSDFVLAAGLLGGSQENLTCSLMLQDDLPSTSELYGAIPEDGSLIGGSVGEFQVLLLESPLAIRSSDFEQSTINLRDLE